MVRDYVNNESGAVTVDWVVLTAAIVGMGVAITSVFLDTLTSSNGSLNRQIAEHGVSTSFE